MNTLSESTTVVAADDCLSTTVDGETVILHPGEGKYYGLNEVGTFVWEHLSGRPTVDEICEEVCLEYDVSTERCRNDVEGLLRDLSDRGLVDLEDTQ